MSGDALFSILSRVGLSPRNLVYKRRVAKTSKEEASSSAFEEKEAEVGFGKEAKTIPTPYKKYLIDEKV